MKKYIAAIAALLLYSVIASAQEDFNDENFRKNVSKEINRQKTANSRDILTNFFRANIDNLLGSEHSFTFNSSLYGIDSIFSRQDRKPGSYDKERILKGISFNFTITGDSSNNIIKYGGGFSFTLLNKKDLLLSPMAQADAVDTGRSKRIENGVQTFYAIRSAVR